MADAQHAIVKHAELVRDFRSAVVKARYVLDIEKTWTRLAPGLCATGLTTAALWLGAIQMTPERARPYEEAIFGAGILAAFTLPFRGAKRSSEKDAIDRLNLMSGRFDRPATLFNDSLAAGSGPEQEAIWQAYRDQLSASIDKFKVGRPRSELPGKDPCALRLGTMVLMAAAFGVANGHPLAWTKPALEWTPPPPPPVLPTVEAWLTPPAYTRQPTMSLYNAQHDAISETRDITVPAGSVLTIHVYKDKNAHVFTEGGAIVPEKKEADLPDTVQNTFQLNNNANIYIEGNARTELRWRFTVIPDYPPVVTITGAPEPVKDRPGMVIVPYAVQDDYGAPLTDARVRILGTRQDPAKPAAPQLALPLR